MDITPLVAKDQQIIQSYSAKGFKVSGTLHEGAICVTAFGTQAWEVEQTALEILSIKNFECVDLETLDVILLGTGAHMQFAPQELRSALSQRGVMLESMDSAAACRTYNVLMTEGRRVAAFLMLPK